MPNTVNGPYTPTTWTQGVTPTNQTNMSNLEKQAGIALNGFNPDLLTAFVLSGITPTGTPGTNTLNIASGRAYVTMSDGSRGLVVVGSTTFNTATPSTTYYLFLLNTGAWQWSTTSTGPANSLAICHATTDGSGNILVVTDDRPTAATLLPGMAGNLQLGTNMVLQNGTGNTPTIYWRDQANNDYGRVDVAAEMWRVLGSYHGGPDSLLFEARLQDAAMTFQGGIVKLSGQATAGSFGVPPIVAQALGVHVTVTTQQTILSYTPTANSWFRVNCHLAAVQAGSSTQLIKLTVNYTDPDANASFPEPIATTGLGTSPTSFSGTNSIPVGPGAAGIYSCIPIVIHAKASTAITVVYQDPGGTPNDFVTAILEQIA